MDSGARDRAHDRLGVTMAGSMLYVVRSGDHLSRIAHENGLDADSIWNHPKNADLKKLRGNPNILCQGDILYLPDSPSPKWFPVTLGTTNKFVAQIPQTTFSVTMTQNGNPIANEQFVVHGLPPPDNTGSTDGQGKLTLTVDVTTRSLIVEFPRIALTRTFRIGHLDPVTEPSGVRQRLAHLGYLAPRASQSGDPSAVASALCAFQNDNKLPPTGELDDATRSALERAHGC